MKENHPDIATQRLPTQKYADVFCSLEEPLDLKKARIEASRCFFCYDAPCIDACPTHIDIPTFIGKIQTGNIKGSALEILSANIMGGTCARVCPVETLCQSACVRNKSEDEPVKIGLLQRFATDEYFKKEEAHPFKRAQSNGKKVAVVGAGPAGLSCAHQLAIQGYEVTVYEAREKAGGLNEYGLAPYKMTDDFAAKEVEFILGVGGIEIKYGKALGKDISLDELKSKYSAVFLGTGLQGTHELGIEGEDLPNVIDAVRFIEKIRQAKDLSKLPVGRRVVVIGAGNTAVDISVQMKRLGAEYVTMVYRRGTEQMGATWHEQEVAQLNGVLIKTWAMPKKILGSASGVTGVEFEETQLDSKGTLKGTGRSFVIEADQVFKAIGQKLTLDFTKKEGSKIAADSAFSTPVPGVFAGGDCVKAGEDLTVTAVEQGKLAARAIHQFVSDGRGV